jgi:hypothetical protein
MKVHMRVWILGSLQEFLEKLKAICFDNQKTYMVSEKSGTRKFRLIPLLFKFLTWWINQIFLTPCI